MDRPHKLEPKETEEKIEQAFSCINNLNRAKANQFLFEKIKSRMGEKNKAASGNRGFIFAAALAMAVMLILNFAVWNNYSANTETSNVSETKQDINSFAKEYFNVNSAYSY